MSHPRFILLDGAAVNLSEGVRASLLQPDLSPGEAEFGTLLDRLRRSLLQVYGLDEGEWAAVLLSGPGSAAVEAMLTGVTPAGSEILIAETGTRAGRMRRMCEAHGIRHQGVHHGWGEPVRMREIEARLRSGSPPSHLALVHHDTATGRLNDLQALGRLCRETGVRMLVDGVGSFGAEAIDFGPLHALAGTAGLCLHGVPGLSFVMVRRDFLEQDIPQRSVHLDLAAHCHAQDRREVLFTPPVQACYALAQALDELVREGGWRSRHGGYRALGAQVRTGLAALDIRPALEDGESSVVLSVYRLPGDLSWERLHDGLKDRGFIVGGGHDGDGRRVFRIAVMGDLDAGDMTRLLQATGEVLG